VRTGWVLLEMMVSLTIFVFVALTVLGAIGQGITAAERTRDRTRAVDLARSTMAKLEAGLGTAQSLAGPVPLWEPPLDADAPFDEAEDGGFSEIAPAPSAWEVEIDTIPSEFPGLTHVIVTAVKRPSPESEETTASYTLQQLVHLAPEVEDTVGELDDIAAGATRGAPVGGPAGRSGGEGGR
jgi:type II secretory pathway pseudopilin PulG